MIMIMVNRCAVSTHSFPAQSEIGDGTAAISPELAGAPAPGPSVTRPDAKKVIPS
jgi:hypothetical protein